MMYNFRNGVASKLNTAGDEVDCPLKYIDPAPTAGILRQPDKHAVQYVRDQIKKLAYYATAGRIQSYRDRLSVTQDPYDKGVVPVYLLTITVNDKPIQMGTVYSFAAIYNFSASPESEVLDRVVVKLKEADVDVEKEKL